MPPKEHRVVLVGAAGVGKTSLLKRLRYNRFDDYVESTIGAAYVPLERRTIQGRAVSVWDTAGQERYRSLVPMYIRDASLVIMCFRARDEDSVQWLIHMQDEILQMNPKCRLMVICTQCDLFQEDDPDRRHAVRVASDRLSLSVGHQTIFASSLNGTGIDEVREAIYALLETRDGIEAGEGGAFRLSDTSLPRAKKSCKC